ncbi:MAG: hypothetical protein KC776_38290 [Myxococcales bacterium]|nr:hypothetical protein [Myxococcales bacterium]MCB9576276.1 hypothetical protein [Polyangiaceae bacterium]
MRRTLGLATLAANAAFVALVGVAMARYPGGTWFDPRATGHDFWRNYLCDLLHSHGLDGRPNPGATLALIGMIAGILSLALAFFSLPEVSARTAARWTRRIGAPAALGILIVPLLPSDRFPFVHGVAVVATGVPAFGGMVLALRALSARRVLFGIGLLLLLSSGADFVLYVWDQFLGGEIVVLSPALQRVATLVLIAFTTAIAIATLRAQSGVARGGPT